MNFRTVSVVMSAWLMGLGAGACGTEGSGPSDGGAGAAVMPQDFFNKAITASCNRLFRCCKQAELTTLMLTTVDDCVQTVTAFASLLGDLKQAVTDKRAVYDEKAAAKCVADIGNASCAETANASNPMAAQASCTAAVKGQIAAGGTCKSGWDCAGGGTCQFAGAPGQGTGTCTVKGKAGAACDFTVDCDDALYCDDTGKCAPKKTNGADCTFEDDCAGGACVNGKCAAAPPMCTGQ
jgi:hypothetical protein